MELGEIIGGMIFVLLLALAGFYKGKFDEKNLESAICKTRLERIK